MTHTKQQQFYEATDLFTARLRTASHWRDSYFGAAYSTRLRKAIQEAREACDAMELQLAE